VEAGLVGLKVFRRPTTIASGSMRSIGVAGYRGVPNPEIRCSDQHLAAAEDISLRLSFCSCQVGR
jgi:hypothetical protein